MESERQLKEEQESNEKALAELRKNCLYLRNRSFLQYTLIWKMANKNGDWDFLGTNNLSEIDVR